MYGKLFTQMYDGTLCTKGPWQALVTFQQFIILADKDGNVDMTADAISRRTTIPLDILETGIKELEQPDDGSRTPDEDGRRIIRLSDTREWGWKIVNYEHYRRLRTAEERREYHRQYARKRNKPKNVESVELNNTNSFNNLNPKQPIAEAEVKEKDKKEKSPPVGKRIKKPQTTFKTFLENCKASGERPVSSYKPVFDYAERIGLPPEFVGLCWYEFKRRYGPGGTAESKRYKDWRMAFRKCVEGNWFKLWYADGDKFLLTTQGLTAEKANRGDVQ